MTDPTSQPSTASTTPTTSTTPTASTTSAADVQRIGGEAKLQTELKQVDTQVGQPIADRPLDGTRDQQRRGKFVDFTAGEKPGEDTNPSTQDIWPSQGSSPATTSTTSSSMTTPTSSVTPTNPTSE